MAGRPQGLREAVPGLRRTLHRFRPYLRDERRLAIGGTTALLLEVVLRLLEPWPVKYVLDAVIGKDGPPPDAKRIVLLAAIATVAIVALRALASYVMTLCFALAGNRLLTKVRADLYAHLHRLSMSFHDKARTGDLVTRVVSDVGRLQEVAVTAMLPLAANTATLVGMVGVVLVLDPQLGLVVLLVFPLFLLNGARLSKRINTVSRKQRKLEGALASMATESLGSMRVVQSYSLEQQMQTSFSGSSQKSLKEGVQGKRLSAALERKTDVLVGVATGLVLFMGANRVLAGALTPGELIVFLTYLKTALKPVRDVAKYTGRIAGAAASGERIVDLLDTEPELIDGPGAVTAPAFSGEVHLEDVHLSYEPGTPVLRGLDLHVPAGQRIALVGPSGAGKSTVAALLSRLRDPDSGRVLLDGGDVRDWTLDSVRAQVAVVLQDSVLFAASVRDNIAYGRSGATEQEVEQAARLAGAHEFVLALPDGYDTVVGERGDTLSGGQRQRVAIARAALRHAPIVVLDEALTGLDQETELEVVAALRRLTEGRTTFVITHDLAAAADADRVVWIDGGRVVDDGPPGEVLARQSGQRPDRPGAAGKAPARVRSEAPRRAVRR